MKKFTAIFGAPLVIIALLFLFLGKGWGTIISMFLVNGAFKFIAIFLIVISIFNGTGLRRTPQNAFKHILILVNLIPITLLFPKIFMNMFVQDGSLLFFYISKLIPEVAVASLCGVLYWKIIQKIAVTKPSTLPPHSLGHILVLVNIIPVVFTFTRNFSCIFLIPSCKFISLYLSNFPQFATALLIEMAVASTLGLLYWKFGKISITSHKEVISVSPPSLSRITLIINIFLISFVILGRMKCLLSVNCEFFNTNLYGFIPWIITANFFGIIYWKFTRKKVECETTEDKQNEQ